MSEWRAVDEDTPRDGTAILAVNTRVIGDHPCVVRWVEANRFIPDDEPHWGDAASTQGDCLYFNSMYFNFWMHLPELPK